MERVVVDGSTIAYERAGVGPLVVLLHGGLSDHREWRRQLVGLSDTFTVVAWDAPGCGDSSDADPSFRMPDYADALAGFVAALDLGKPHLVGLSWGSTVALEMYRRHPTIPASLVLTSAYAGWAGSLAPEVVAERVDGLRRGLQLPPERWVREYWIPTLFTDRAPTDMVEEAVRDFSRAEELHREIPNSELIVLPDVGHQCNIEAAASYNAALRAFLAKR
ncbi:MAG: alpha/beta hydrolase [Actinomycetota bacterium]